MRIDFSLEIIIVNILYRVLIVSIPSLMLEITLVNGESSSFGLACGRNFKILLEIQTETYLFFWI
jgi:hypothetical protein